MSVELGRGRRYAVESPVVYRQVGSTPWRSGRTVSVSRTDVLFRAPAPAVPDGGSIEMVLSLPPIGVQPGARVRCMGTVVGSGEIGIDGQVSTTATIERYEFVRGETGG